MTAPSNISGAARWYGHPALVHRLIEHSNYRYNYESVIDTIDVAIGGHNRGGGYSEYSETVVMQLEQLKAQGDLEKAKKGSRLPTAVPHGHRLDVS